jgi:outer membrane protein assembly factor BamA
MDRLTYSPSLPKPEESSSELFDKKAADELMELLDLDLQPAWAPQRPKLRTGLDLVRYNRVEGLSVGAVVTQTLGAGYSLSAVGRIGHEDRHANGEFTVERGNGRRVVRGTVYHRLSAVNPEWAGALSWGPSLPALVYARDEGFYYRNFGAELTDRRESSGHYLTTRLFLERQWTAGDSGVRNTFSLVNRRFLPNILAEEVSLTGLSTEWLRSYEPRFGIAFSSAFRGEAATGTFEYGRGSLELTATRPIERFAFSVAASAGASLGRVPVQRQWYMGGLRTVRGQIAGTEEGNAFWLARTELGTRQGVIRPVVFFDIGWAGRRSEFFKTDPESLLGRSQPLRGAGVGVSLIDGLFRIDFSRGLNVNRKWRTDVYLSAQL